MAITGSYMVYKPPTECNFVHVNMVTCIILFHIVCKIFISFNCFVLFKVKYLFSNLFCLNSTVTTTKLIVLLWVLDFSSFWIIKSEQQQVKPKKKKKTFEKLKSLFHFFLICGTRRLHIFVELLVLLLLLQRGREDHLIRASYWRFT